MNFLKYIFLILFNFSLIISPNFLYGYESNLPKTNFEIIDSLLNNYTDKFAGSQNLQNGDFIRLEITNHPAKWMLRDKLIRVLAKDSCVITNDSVKSASRTFDININNISVKYLNYNLNSDSLERELLIYISGSKLQNNTITPLEEYKVSYNDRIARDNVESVDSKQYDFTTSPVPSQENTFFEEIVQPVILITSTVVAVVLLFTVRSN